LRREKTSCRRPCLPNCPTGTKCPIRYSNSSSCVWKSDIFNGFDYSSKVSFFQLRKVKSSKVSHENKGLTLCRIFNILMLHLLLVINNMIWFETFTKSYITMIML
jgi:hypothetical protein